MTKLHTEIPSESHVEIKEILSEIERIENLPVKAIVRLQSEIVFWGAIEAKKALTENPFPKQRPLRTKYVLELANDMRKGKFPDHTTIEFCHFEGKIYLTNGQHRLTAVTVSKVKQTFNVLHIYCTTWDQVEAAYMQTDVGKGRTTLDMIRASNLSDVTELPADWSHRLSRAIGFIKRGFQETCYTPSATDKIENIEILKTWQEEAHLYLNTIAGHSPIVKDGFRRIGTIALALVTFRYHPELACKFWKSVAMVDSLSKGDPCHTCMTLLATKGGRGFYMEPETKRLAFCWNAYATGRTLEIARTGKDDNPIHIAGTPYNGERIVLLD